MQTPVEKLKNEDLANLNFRKTYSRIFSYVTSFSVYFLFATFGFVLFAASQPAFAILMEMFVNALDGKVVNGLYLIPAACVAIALMRGVGSYLGSYYMAKVTENVVFSIRGDLFKNILALPISYFDTNKSGRLISLFTYNTGLMATTTAGAMTTIVREGLTVIALFAYLFYQSAQLTLIFLILGPPLVFIINWIGKKIKRLGHGIQATVGELNHVAAEVFSGIRLIKSSVAEGSSNDRFNTVSEKTKKLGLRMAKVNSIYTPLMQMMIVFAMAVLMYVVLLSRETMDPAALIAYVTAAALLPKPIRSLSGVHPKLLQGVVAAGEVFRHIDYQKEIDAGTYEKEGLEGEVEFKGVSFTYDGSETKVLKDLGFKIQPGETLALVGRSGGGKSTLVNLIPRFYEVTEGQITIDNEPIENYKLDFLRQNIAVVSQNVTLFNCSVADNIAFGLDEISRADIEEAARAANASEFIEALPGGYDTLVGENGVLLSGGQRQRLAIARAMLRNAPILILDEATSALDNESEVKVQTALERIMKNRTTIVIAHRLSTIEHADKIIVMDEGSIIEQGSHAELMQAGGQYARMVQRDFSE